ncbi:MAG: hypothetical protein ACRDNZ_06460, partial [Streptosporangiaceae bacterium]
MGLIKGIQAQRRHIAGALAVCLAAALIGLLAATLLGHRNSRTAAGPVAAGPASPPVRVCGAQAVLGGGPSSPPAGAVTVPAGDDAAVNWGRPGTVYWFAPGEHTLGTGAYTQIIAGRRSTYTGAPGAVLDGRHANYYAFGGDAPNVTISYLTVRDFGV